MAGKGKKSTNIKDLSLKEIVKQISSKGVDYLTTNVLFNLLFKIATEYIDYYESDLGDYLFPKLYKKFYTHIILRIIILALYIMAISLFLLLEAPLLISVFGIIAVLLYLTYFIVDKMISRKYGYSTYFFYKAGKKLILFKHKLDLIIHNSYLSENYRTLDIDLDKVKSLSNQLKNRIERDTRIIRPYSYHIKEYALLSILFAPMVPFFITLIIKIVQNPISINLDSVIDLISGLSMLSLLLFQSINSLVKVKKSRIFKEASIYFFYDYMTIIILEVIRLNIRVQQFPDEKELKKGLINVMYNLTDKFKKKN